MQGWKQEWTLEAALTLALGCTGAMRQGWGGDAERGRLVRLYWELLAELLRLSHSTLRSSSTAAESLVLTRGQPEQLDLWVSPFLLSSGQLAA